MAENVKVSTLRQDFLTSPIYQLTFQTLTQCWFWNVCYSGEHYEIHILMISRGWTSWQGLRSCSSVEYFLWMDWNDITHIPAPAAWRTFITYFGNFLSSQIIKCQGFWSSIFPAITKTKFHLDTVYTMTFSKKVLSAVMVRSYPSDITWLS